jgi:hypothetical protein
LDNLDLICFKNILSVNLLVVLVQNSFLPTTLEVLSDSFFEKAYPRVKISKHSTEIGVDQSFLATIQSQVFRAIIK